jgi:hypothetical protein
MLSSDDKARIRAEEDYRNQLRSEAQPIKTISFSDKLTKFNLYLSVFGSIAVVVFLVWLWRV